MRCWVDTPEVYFGTQPYGAESSAAFAKQVLEGQEVGLELDARKVDPYGRLLAYVYLPDGVMFNETLRLRRRGFNQAALLARGLADSINTPVSDTLQVVRSTRDQVELSAAEKRQNVVGAFSAMTRTRGKLLLVDDVFTTGATTSACAAALLDAGAAEVHAITLCRTC